LDSKGTDSESLDELLNLLREMPDAGPADKSAYSAEAAGRTACLSAMEVGELATGAIESGRAAKLLEHAASCDLCARALAEAKRDLARDLSAEEEAVLASLSSSRTEWQSRLADRITKKRKPYAGLWIGIAAAALLSIAIGIAWSAYRNQPKYLIARVYQAGRPFEYRLDLPGYSAVRQERGATGGIKSADFLEAEAKLMERQRKGANDMSNLRLLGIADLFQGNADSASEYLTRALAAAPRDDTAARGRLLTELAVAKALEADQNSQSFDYGAALNYLAEAVHYDPQNRVAVFNTALVFERLKEYDQAADYWTRYLKLDGISRWSGIAKEHLAEIQTKKKLGPPR
jgi:tetratricopeptide (TPR) repeat protein